MELLRILLLTVAFVGCQSHECYVCHQQDGNRGKCTETVESCNYTQDHCLSEVHWGSTLYWEIGAPMQFYINKRCADKSECQTTIAKFMPRCEHIWWKDWTCAECCKGDRCNFFITLGSSSVSSSTFIIMSAAVLAVALQRYVR